MEWYYFHAYNHLANDGKVKYLSCPSCDTRLATILGGNDEPALWCRICDTVIKPGLDVYDQIKMVVREHYV